MRRTAASFIFASVLLTGTALASGYGLRAEVSASSLGLSAAGAAANGTRASNLAFNPALLGDVDNFDMASSFIGLLPNTAGDFTATSVLGSPIAGTTHQGGIVNTALIPSSSIRWRLTDQFIVGLVVSAPWGMVTDYDAGWVGRYYATKSDVKTYNFQPMAAWQPVPELTIAGGMQVQYIKGVLGKAIDFGLIGALHSMPGSSPEHMDGSVLLKAQDWAIGYVLGVLWKPTADLSIGLSYRSELDNTLKGTETFTLDTAGIGAYLAAHAGMFTNSSATAGFTNPAVATIGLRYSVNDKLALLVGADWTGWSAFDTLVAHSSNVHQPDDVTTMNWKNSWSVSLGAEYKLLEDWTVRLGTSYDETPTVNNYRTPGIPDGARYWLSAGVGYALTDKIDLDLSVARLFAKKGNIHLTATPTNENAARGNLNGSVQMGVTLVGFQVSYHL